MLTTRKADAGFVRITICFHLISALLPNLKQRGLYLVRKRFNAVGFHLTRSSSGTASISATLMGYGGKREWPMWWRRASPVPINIGLQAGVKPALTADYAVSTAFHADNPNDTLG